MIVSTTAANEIENLKKRVKRLERARKASAWKKRNRRARK